jgi:flavin-dependent dehydrogenase
VSADVDLLVVGGGPVGLGTALVAARSGLSCAVLEQRRDPVDKACGEGLMPSGLALLARLGVDPAGRDFTGIRYLDAVSGAAAEARFRLGPGRGVRRTVLHQALAAAADAAGVKRIQTRVDGVRQHADRVEAGGVTGTYLAAADGLRSTVRRQYGLERQPRARLRYGLRGHFAAAPWTDLVEVYWAAGAELYVTPVAERLVGVAVLTEHRGRSFDEWLAQAPRLRERLAGAAPVTRVRGAGPLERNVARRVVGRVLLVGDAAGYVDALTGEGIAVGLAAAHELVHCVAAGRPQDYEAAWVAASRRYRMLTRGLLLAAQRRPLRTGLVPAARALPPVFERVVNALA